MDASPATARSRRRRRQKPAPHSQSHQSRPVGAPPASSEPEAVMRTGSRSESGDAGSYPPRYPQREPEVGQVCSSLEVRRDRGQVAVQDFADGTSAYWQLNLDQLQVSGQKHWRHAASWLGHGRLVPVGALKQAVDRIPQLGRGGAGGCLVDEYGLSVDNQRHVDPARSRIDEDGTLLVQCPCNRDRPRLQHFRLQTCKSSHLRVLLHDVPPCSHHVDTDLLAAPLDHVPGPSGAIDGERDVLLSCVVHCPHKVAPRHPRKNQIPADRRLVRKGQPGSLRLDASSEECVTNDGTQGAWIAGTPVAEYVISQRTCGLPDYRSVSDLEGGQSISAKIEADEGLPLTKQTLDDRHGSGASYNSCSWAVLFSR